MKLEIHVHVHQDDSVSLALLNKIYLLQIHQGRQIIALSEKMQAFVDSSNAAFSAAADSLANINADVQKLLAGGNMSAEDAAALDGVSSALNTLKDNLASAAAVVPE